jgi:hypothetical protein
MVVSFFNLLFALSEDDDWLNVKGNRFRYVKLNSTHVPDSFQKQEEVATIPSGYVHLLGNLLEWGPVCVRLTISVLYILITHCVFMKFALPSSR